MMMLIDICLYAFNTSGPGAMLCSGRQGNLRQVCTLDLNDTPYFWRRWCTMQIETLLVDLNRHFLLFPFLDYRSRNRLSSIVGFHMTEGLMVRWNLKVASVSFREMFQLMSPWEFTIHTWPLLRRVWKVHQKNVSTNAPAVSDDRRNHFEALRRTFNYSTFSSQAVPPTTQGCFWARGLRPSRMGFSSTSSINRPFCFRPSYRLREHIIFSRCYPTSMHARVLSPPFSKASSW